MRSRIDPAHLDVVILCGGRGERLRSVVHDRPKPLAEVGGRPFLDILIAWAAGYGLRRFILLAGYMGGLIKQYALKKAASSPFQVLCVIEPAVLDTAGAIRNAAGYIKSPCFLTLNGDSICPVDLGSLLEFHRQKNALVTVILSRAEKTGDYGQVLINEDGLITSFQEKKAGNPSGGLVNAGAYLMEQTICDLLPAGCPHSLERDVFPLLACKKNIYGYVADKPHVDIGTPERYAGAQTIFESNGWINGSGSCYKLFH